MRLFIIVFTLQIYGESSAKTNNYVSRECENGSKTMFFVSKRYEYV